MELLNKFLFSVGSCLNAIRTIGTSSLNIYHWHRFLIYSCNRTVVVVKVSGQRSPTIGVVESLETVGT